jgi:hypothetical protein
MLYMCLQEKASVIVGWVVVMVIWLIKSGVLLIVLLFLYSTVANAVAWVLCVVLAVFSFCKSLIKPKYYKINSFRIHNTSYS